MLIVFAAIIAHAAAEAQTFPTRPVRIIVTTAAGGGADITMRTIGQKLTESWGRAVSSTARSRALPDLPTIAEAGVPGYEAAGWYGIVAPAATPRAIVAALNSALVRVLRSPEIIERFARSGIDTVGSTPETFSAHMRAETERWRRLAKIAGIAKQP